MTYRVYDYARTDKFGNQRELHIDKALEVTNLSKPNSENDFGEHLVKCDYFTADRVSGEYGGVCNNNSFVSILITDGTGKIENNGDILLFKKGNSLFLPAGSGSFSLHGDYEAIITRI